MVYRYTVASLDFIDYILNRYFTYIIYSIIPSTMYSIIYSMIYSMI